MLSYGKTFSGSEVDSVWRKGQVVPGYNPDDYRKDAAGAWIMRAMYGKQTEYGWQIDHIIPVSKGGSDCMSNLQPLQHENNLSKNDNYPTWIAVRTASGNCNIAFRQQVVQ